jgi:hypothetical protein
MARPYQGDPAMQKNWVFEQTEPVLDVEVSLLSAPGAHIELVRGPKRDDAIRIIVDQCSSLFGREINGRVEHVRHSNFNHHGMTVHIVIAARESDELDQVIERELGALEQSLEASIQSHFGWEKAAVSVQIDPNPAYEARRGRRSQPRPGNPDDINVWQPAPGNNAIAPVIVTMPNTGTVVGGGPPPVITPVKQSSAAVAGLLGAVLAVGFAIMVALAIGPLTDEIGGLYQDRELSSREHANEIRLRNQQIASLRRENGRMNDTINRLASRRGQPAMRSDQPTRTLPDTDSVGPLAAASPAAGPAASASGAP